MKIPSGSTDRYIYFVAVDATDLKTRETGLSSFTVYGSKNGAAAAAFTTPTVNETDSSDMPGVYELLLDEQTTLTAGHDAEELCLHITCSGMAPVTRTVELYRVKGSEGDAFVDADVLTIEGSDATNAINAACDTALTDYDAVVPDDLPTNFGALAITETTGKVTVDNVNDCKATGFSTHSAGDVLNAIQAEGTSINNILEDTGTTIPGLINGLNNIAAADVGSLSVETGYTILQALQAILAFAAGKSSGGGTTSVAFRDMADSKDRIAATVDSSGNRTAVTVNKD
jgi:hypothetical protein